ncbi:MAD-domain-containing protein [Mycena olivaceomarginata]|nr:MAD-domain-containing protein [Mycena olivaceomarginata]
MNDLPSVASTSRISTAMKRTDLKRDSFAAELERDPQLSAAKRQQRTQAFTSNMAHASLERQLVAAQKSHTGTRPAVFSDREQEEREEKERERAEYEEQTVKKDSELRTLRNSLTTLREEFADLQDVYSSLQRSTSQTIRVAKVANHNTDPPNISVGGRGLAVQAPCGGTEPDYRRNTSSVPGAQAENNDMVVVREELHRQAAYLRTLESTNTKLTSELTVLRARQTSVEVLREEKRGLELKLQPLEDLREKVVKLEAQVEAGRQERETCRNVASTSTPSKTPVAVTQGLSALRLQHAQLLEDHGATIALLRSKEAELANAELRAAEAQETIEKLEGEVTLLNDKAYRCEQATALAEREGQFMKALLSSFSLEEANKEGGSIDAVRTEQVQQLEKLLEDYKAANARLTQQINEVASREPVSLTEERKQELERERAASLQAQQGLHSIYFHPRVRLISHADLDAALSEMEELQKGGARVENIVTDTNSNEHLIPKESWDAVCKERDELQGMVKQKETRLKRLKEVFSSKAEEFKESIAALLGVKLAFFPSGQVRVTSLYDLSATFVFKPASSGSGGSMELMAQGEGGPEDLPHLMAYWVGTEQCHTGFFGEAFTLELYDRWKQEGRPIQQ